MLRAESEKFRIVGFMLVRLPEENFDDEVLGYPKIAPQIGKVRYSGATRLAWSDLDELYFRGSPSPATISFVRDLRKANADFTGLSTWSDLQQVERIHCELPDPHRREIISVFSERLGNVKGSFETAHPLEFLGFDSFLLGSHSLIFEGIFLTPEFDSSEWFQKLNENGLFQNSDVAVEFGKAFSTWSSTEGNEPMDPRKLESIEIYRVS